MRCQDWLLCDYNVLFVCDLFAIFHLTFHFFSNFNAQQAEDELGLPAVPRASIRG